MKTTSEPDGPLLDVIVIGGGQAGLATAWYLRRAGLSHVVLDAEEKPGGLYDALGVCVPEHRARLRELVDDHFRLAALVRDAGERARRAHGTEADVVLGEVARLAAALADHERRELEMVQAATAGDRSAAPA